MMSIPDVYTHRTPNPESRGTETTFTFTSFIWALSAMMMITMMITMTLKTMMVFSLESFTSNKLRYKLHDK